ncbi:MAG: DUF4286 family protein [Proteobacteria bacterium]|nr:DUF4286 family protein [Pseudomonadota bacterium]
MSRYPACLLIVTAEIDAEVEAEWNTWYNEVHLPDALACPGVIGGQRYVSVGEASAIDKGERTTNAAKTYTTVYELAGPEALETAEFKAMRGWYQFSGRIKASTRVVQAL